MPLVVNPEDMTGVLTKYKITFCSLLLVQLSNQMDPHWQYALAADPQYFSRHGPSWHGSSSSNPALPKSYAPLPKLGLDLLHCCKASSMAAMFTEDLILEGPFVVNVTADGSTQTVSMLQFVGYAAVR